MRPLALPLMLAFAAALAGCHKSPQDAQADHIKAVADAQAKQVAEASRAQADRLDDQAQQLKTQAKQAGGYTGERLGVRADALAREAGIVEKQGRTQAAALREAADAQAKQITAR